MDSTLKVMRTVEVAAADVGFTLNGVTTRFTPRVVWNARHTPINSGRRMCIERVVEGGDHIEVTTAGGLFKVTRSEMTLSGKGVPVAELRFTEPLGGLHLARLSENRCLLNSGRVLLNIGGDSLARVSNIGTDPFEYTFRSLVVDPEWCRRMGPQGMWADGQRGCLHMCGPSGWQMRYSSAPGMKIELAPAAESAAALLPSRPLPLERMYGQGARPHVYFSPDSRREGVDRDISYLDGLRDRGFGVVVLFHAHYPGGNASNEAVFNPETARLEYNWVDPDQTKRLIDAAHERGFKVPGYLQGRQFEDQPLETTLAWMREFQTKWNLQGWYFDNAVIGSWPASYEFVRRVREDVGEEGILYHHCSVDTLGNMSGIAFSPLNAWMDYTLVGEVGLFARLTSPSAPYYRHYTAGYAGCICDHKSHIRGGSTVTEREQLRLLGCNLLGTCRLARPETWDDEPPWNATRQTKMPGGTWRREKIDWDGDYAPFYDAHKEAYLRGEDVELVWPPTLNGDTSKRQKE